jgi:ankyrin repeat protein
LDETYERILLSADEDYQDIIAEALRWLCFSEVTLTIAQLAEAAIFSATVESPSEEAPLEISFDNDAFFQDPLDILGLLSGLVVCLPLANTDDFDEWDDMDDLEELGDTDEADKSDSVVDSDDMEHQAPEPLAEIGVKSKILLSHFSVKEYLTSGRLRSQVCCFSMDEGRAYEVIATNCIYFILCFQESPDGPEASSSNYFIDLTHSRPFFVYACRHWDNLARKVDYESKLTDLIISILKAELRLRKFFLTKAVPDDLKSPDIPPLYFAAALQLYWPCKKLTQNGVDGNGQEGYWGHALQAASTFGAKNLIQLLLYHGADANIRGGHYETALNGALSSRNENIVRPLLEYGANINLETEHYGTALQAASTFGAKNLVQLLLYLGADVNARGGRYGTALQAAIYQYESGIVQLLLHHGADVISEVGYYDTLLTPWMQRGDSRIAIMLLEHGAAISNFGGGSEAEEALARKDFRKFVAIQVEALLKQKARGRRQEPKNDSRARK